MISFAVNPYDAKVILAISERAVIMIRRLTGEHPKLQDLMMDVTAIHANGCPLRLAELRDADDFNFAHDIGGIRKHINRTTGKLDGHFLPRFAIPGSRADVLTLLGAETGPR